MSRYGGMGASSRLRFYQFIPSLTSAGIQVAKAPLLADSYLEDLYTNNRRSLRHSLAGYYRRLQQLARANEFDLLWVESEILPWLPYWVEDWLTGDDPPFIVDYDDATFHRYGLSSNRLVRALVGKKIEQVMRKARLVIAGNQYLAQHACIAGARNVAFLPTVIDTEKYQPIERRAASPAVIGWIGTPATVTNLELVVTALRKACQLGLTKVVLIGAGNRIPHHIVAEVRPWAEESEVEEIRSLDIGIMPLRDEPFERGKCGYKLIQYMGCGLPVIASPVGANKIIVESGINGFLATTGKEWFDAISKLAEDVNLRQAMGSAGREKVEKEYSLRLTAEKLITLLTAVVQGRAIPCDALATRTQ